MASVVISGDTSGAITISAPAVAGTNTLTLPVATDTLVGKTTTDTLTNKTLTSPVISTISNTGTITLPTSTDTLVGRATTDTLTNKTLTSPTLTTPALGTPASGVLTSCTGVNYDGYKNRIINGAMVIDQRNAGVSYTQVNGLYNLDRWAGNTFDGGAATNKFSVIQSSTAPTGFSKSLLVTSLAATSSASSNIFNIEQKIEGFNFADFMYGTANAQTLTLSFWVRSSLTGTFGGALKNSARDRAYPFTYTISTANTFEQKTITITGDTSGTWVGGTNGIGLWISFGLGVGSSYSGTANAWGAGDIFSATGATSVVGTNGATFYITGVQLEKGSTATSFDYRPYGAELALCQRYYQDGGFSMAGYTLNTEAFGGAVYFSVTKRTAPTIAFTNVVNTNNTGCTAFSIKVSDFRAQATANGTTRQFLSCDYTASAEL
jgi:hypothetical protein